MLNFFLTPLATFASCWVRIFKAPGSTIFTVVTVGVILSLPAAFFFFSANLKQITDELEEAAEITLFLSKDASPGEVEELFETIAALPQINTAEIISEDEALENFKTLSGLYSIIEFMPENPLPTAIAAKPAGDFSSAESIQRLNQQFLSMPLVDAVDIDLLWIQRLLAIVELLRIVFYSVSGLLLAIATLLICNTTRIAIASRADEIFILQLIGGTSRFVRRSFIYTAVMQSMIGTVLACGIVETLRYFVAQPVNAIATLYNSDFELIGLSAQFIGLCVLSVAFLTWASAWITVSFYLRQSRE